MAAVVPPADQAADLMQKMSLDSQAKALEIPEPTKSTAVYQYGAVDPTGQYPSFDRSFSPLLPSDAMDPTLCYVPNAYQPYYFGGYGGNGHEWNEYTSYTNPEGVDVNSGIYGENGSLVYQQGYGYPAAYPYPQATSPAPAVGSDGQVYGAQQYHYPSYFPPTASNGPFSSSTAASSHGDLSAIKASNEKSLPVDSTNTASSKSGVAKGNKQSNQTLNPSTNLYGNGAPGGGFVGNYQDPRLSYDGFYTHMSWQDGSKLPDAHRLVSGSGIATSLSKTNNAPSSRNQNYRSNSHYSGLHQTAPLATGYGGAHEYYNRMYPTRLYSRYGSNVRSGMGYYDSRTNGRGWGNVENKYRSQGRGNNYLYGNENIDGLNELNRGPRAKGPKSQKGVSETETSNLTEAGERDEACVVPDRAQCNGEDFPEEYTDAKFFVIKSYSEDDVHKSIKYNVWASTPNGNKKLDAAYQEAQQKPGSCPVFLMFSVNASGQFVGIAEMVGPVDFDKNVEYWQQDKWTGHFPLKWHIVKDVPNSMLKHITLENNENKPVTNSRDTQEVKLEQGLKMIKIFKEHSSKTCILDDFSFYEIREKTIQEKKAKQQSQKQVWEEGKGGDDKKEYEKKSDASSSSTAELTKETASSAVEATAESPLPNNGC